MATQRAYEEATRVPDRFQNIEPAKDLHILSFLEIKLPKEAKCCSPRVVETCFTNETPEEDEKLQILETLAIPSGNWLDAMEQAIYDEWIKGKKSIIYPRSEGLRLPLWVLRFWRNINRAVSKQREWAVAVGWLNSLIKNRTTNKNSERAAQVLATLEHLVWTQYWHAIGGGVSVTGLASLLAKNSWLTTDHINAAIYHVYSRLNLRSELASSNLVAPLSFSDAVMSYSTSSEKNTIPTMHPYLQSYTNVFRSKKRARIYFPVNINNNHWIAVCVDFENRTVSYGEFRVCSNLDFPDVFSNR